jgi:hypothetical protein
MDKLIMIGISTIGGRAFYTALGHFNEAHSNPICLGHILADIKLPWVIGAILATLMSNGSACLWGQYLKNAESERYKGNLHIKG